MNNRKPDGYWNIKENCFKEALKYESRKEFRVKSIGACVGSIRNGWYNEITSHMVKLGSKFERVIYSFEFPDNSVYIGLTFNPNERYKKHMKEGSVYKHIVSTNLNPIFKILTDYLNADEASEKEGYILDEYKNNGWKILNKNKTGGLGGNELIWNREKCIEESKKYSSRSEFQKKSSGAYDAAYRNGWIDEIYTFLKSKKGEKWSYDRCKTEAMKYKHKKDFILNSKSAYVRAHSEKWLDSICSHMIPLRKKADS
jgi:predicted GIY-YIG superfamily endonuclease